MPVLWNRSPSVAKAPREVRLPVWPGAVLVAQEARRIPQRRSGKCGLPVQNSGHDPTIVLPPEDGVSIIEISMHQCSRRVELLDSLPPRRKELMKTVPLPAADPFQQQGRLQAFASVFR